MVKKELLITIYNYKVLIITIFRMIKKMKMNEDLACTYYKKNLKFINKFSKLNYGEHFFFS